MISSAPQSKVAAIYETMVGRIQADTWSVGSLLPTEFQLAAEFDCGRHTISLALARLAHEGLVERRKRAGTRVIRKSAVREKSTLQLEAFAFIYPSEQHAGLRRTVHGFQDAASEKKRPVVLLSGGVDYQKEAEFVKRLVEFDVRGAVMHPVIRTTADQTRFGQMLAASKFPIVLLDANLPGVDCPVVSTDGFDAGYTVTRHLIDRGAKKIGFFADHARAPTMRDRYQGYRWALKEAGIPENPAWLYLESSMTPNYTDPYKEPTRMAADYLEKSPGVDGVVCAHDFLAVGLIFAARARGLRLPQDLKIVGIDGHAIAAQPDISLTTYEAPSETTGRKAFEILEALVGGATLSQTEFQLKGSLTVRASSQ